MLRFIQSPRSFLTEIWVDQIENIKRKKKVQTFCERILGATQPSLPCKLMLYTLTYYVFGQRPRNVVHSTVNDLCKIFWHDIIAWCILSEKGSKHKHHLDQLLAASITKKEA